MIKDTNVDIRFFIKGERHRYAQRSWPHVPRVGDEVMLHAGGAYEFIVDANGKAAFRVTRVVWGVESDDQSWQSVSIEIDNIK